MNCSLINDLFEVANVIFNKYCLKFFWDNTLAQKYNIIWQKMKFNNTNVTIIDYNMSLLVLLQGAFINDVTQLGGVGSPVCDTMYWSLIKTLILV